MCAKKKRWPNILKFLLGLGCLRYCILESLHYCYPKFEGTSNGALQDSIESMFYCMLVYIGGSICIHVVAHVNTTWSYFMSCSEIEQVDKLLKRQKQHKWALGLSVIVATGLTLFVVAFEPFNEQTEMGSCSGSMDGGCGFYTIIDYKLRFNPTLKPIGIEAFSWMFPGHVYLEDPSRGTVELSREQYELLHAYLIAAALVVVFLIVFMLKQTSSLVQTTVGAKRIQNRLVNNGEDLSGGLSTSNERVGGLELSS